MKRIRLWYAFQMVSIGCLFAPDTTIGMFIEMALEVSQELGEKDEESN
jgi:hypothetical protein